MGWSKNRRDVSPGERGHEPRAAIKDRALLDIIIAIGVVIDGADGWVGVEEFGTNKRMWLGRLAVDHKSNEISVIPLHLDLLDVRDAIVTIGAMGCQTAIVE